MKNLLERILIIVSLILSFSIPAAAADDLARKVLAEINLARTEPGSYAGFLRESRSRYEGKLYRMPDSDTFLETQEGVAALDEAIKFLAHQKPLTPLDWSAGLAAAAAELAREQGKTSSTGHIGAQSGGMQARLERHGTVLQGRIGENIAYGPEDPRRMVMQLIIDDGVPDRGHRKNLYNAHFDSAGIACGPHPDFGNMCVIDFAKGFMSK
ncbi:MAG: serine protease [Desulfobulbaceae bacterium BRH_c16a]|nr:MAG: serine protease [Desulfobulbaceae bacterium BRH_c16a]